MRLATRPRKDAGTGRLVEDGELVVVDSTTTRWLPVPEAPSIREALEDWTRCAPCLERAAAAVENGGGEPLDVGALLAPLPRTFSLLDGSAYLEHIKRVRRARGAEPPADMLDVPLMYQGAGDHLLRPTEDIPLPDVAWGLDVEAEVCVVLGEVPRGTSAEAAAKYIRLLVVMNDLSFRNLIPRELAAGFGFFHGKPASSFAPFAVTPDELGAAWRDCRLHLSLVTEINGARLGDPDTGEMHFSFAQLIAHAAKTRHLPPGTILGAGTVSNRDESRGTACLAERRVLEQLRGEHIQTPFLKPGDTLQIEARLGGRAPFGTIRQRVIDAA